VVKAAAQGDEIANEIIARAGKYLGIMVGNVIAVISPQMIIFGWGGCQSGDVLLSYTREAVRQRMSVLPIDKIQFSLAKLGNQAGLVGTAAWAARQSMHQRQIPRIQEEAIHP
jgi:glucokinase